MGLGGQSDDGDDVAHLRGEDDSRAAGEHDDDDEAGEDDPEHDEYDGAVAPDAETYAYMHRAITSFLATKHVSLIDHIATRASHTPHTRVVASTNS